MNRIRIMTTIVVVLASPGALAQADDPAVQSCEMLVREELPGNLQYRQLSAEIAGTTVALRYETRDAAGGTNRHEKRCAFTFNAATASWGFAPGLPESLSVAVMGALVHRGIYPIPREATALRP
jgi:hypothetical protein